ncbi:MAG: J domain-containing protein, partial [Polyangiaceae bacterium]
MTRTVRRSEDALAVTLNEDEQLVFDALVNADDEPSVAAVSGLSLAQVRHLVERLAMMGAVVFTGGALAEDGLAESDEVALDPLMRARIDELYDTLDSVDYYTLLGVNRAATSADIRRAYHKLAPEFHPDRYFRKNLGEYKNKIEKVFAGVTRAHDTLRYKTRRRAYDDSASSPPPDSAPRAAPEPSNQGSAASDAAAGRRQAQTQPHAAPSVGPAGRAVVEAHGAEAMARTRQLRRAALARKLGAGRGADHRRRRLKSEDSGYQSVAGVEQ